jgi:hypothetical protein
MIPFRATALILLLVSLFDLHGQQSQNQPIDSLCDAFDRLYGLDQNLVNGIRYKVEYPGSEGHPYLGDQQIYSGSVTLDGREYTGLHLGYNVHNQSVVLEYMNLAGAPDRIVLHNEFIDVFELDRRRFEKHTFEMTGTSFFQVFDSGDIRCLLQWDKRLMRSNTSLTAYYSYSEPRRKFYLLHNGILSEFKSKKGFVKCFGEEYKKQIKQYFKQRSIQLNYITDTQLQSLLDYCDGISEE